MNRKEAERLSADLRLTIQGSPFVDNINRVHQAYQERITRLLLRIYKKGVKDALNKIESLDPLESTCCGEWDDVCDVAEGVQKWLLIQARKKS